MPCNICTGSYTNYTHHKLLILGQVSFYCGYSLMDIFLVYLKVICFCTYGNLHTLSFLQLYSLKTSMDTILLGKAFFFHENQYFSHSYFFLICKLISSPYVNIRPKRSLLKVLIIWRPGLKIYTPKCKIKSPLSSLFKSPYDIKTLCKQR